MNAKEGMTARPGASRAKERAAEAAEGARPALVPQRHGGALLSGGVPGNKGGAGRPKDELRAKMRGALDQALDALLNALAGERLAHDAMRRLLADERVSALGPEVGAIIAAACDEHLSAKLSARELVAATDVLSKYGVGLSLEAESKATSTSYVIHIPARVSNVRAPAPEPIAVVNPPHNE